MPRLLGVRTTGDANTRVADGGAGNDHFTQAVHPDFRKTLLPTLEFLCAPAFGAVVYDILDERFAAPREVVKFLVRARIERKGVAVRDAIWGFREARERL